MRGERLYRLLIWLYPRRFRAAWRDALLQDYREHARAAAGVGSRVRLCGLIARDLVRSVPVEHVEEYRRRQLERRMRGARPPGEGVMASMGRDVRHALRALSRVPGFTAACLFTLALGVGATTTIFSIVDGVLLRPLPFEEADRLVQLGAVFGDVEVSSSSPPDFFDLQRRARSFDALAASRLQWMDMRGTGETERFDAAGVSASYFDVLGVQPALGRAFRRADDGRAGEAVVVLSDGLWRRRFGADPGVLGRALTLNGRPFTVVGVMPAGFSPPAAIYHGDLELWFPLGQVDDDLESRDSYFIQVIGRLSATATIASARAELQSIGRVLDEQYPGESPRDYWVADLRERTIGDVGFRLYVLLGATGFLLLIACANVANLFLVRATDRTREIAVRSALGAGRRRIASQLLTESLVMALVGGLLGMAVAWAGLRAFQALSPGDVPRLAEVSLDLRVLGFALVLSVATGLLFGLAPALYGTRSNLTGVLKEGGALSAGRGRNTVRAGLTVAQIAISLVLLTGAGLLINSLVRLSRVDPGFEPAGVVWIDVEAPDRIEDGSERAAYFERVRERLSALPGVRSVGAIHGLPLDRNRSLTTVLPEGYERGDDDDVPRVPFFAVTAGYFSTLDIPLRGRDFSSADRADAAPVVIINESFARRFWPDGSALGRRIRAGDPDSAPWATIVGVAADVRHFGLGQDVEPMLYNPVAQFPRTWLAFTIRHATSAATLLPAVRAALWEMEPDLPLNDFGTLEAHVSASIVEPRFYTALLAAFGAAATALAFVGLYGNLAYTVRLRRREMGIRLALGAAPRDVRRLVVGQGIRLALLGIAVGAAAALAGSRVLSSLVFGVTPRDPATFTAVALAMLAIAAAACWAPARRAAATDPNRTLRTE